jgi:hypothetical protein
VLVMTRMISDRRRNGQSAIPLQMRGKVGGQDRQDSPATIVEMPAKQYSAR